MEIKAVERLQSQTPLPRKVHIHSEQFDGAPHAWCGWGSTAVSELRFEATPSAQRCKICERYWFPHGQPDWHYRAAVAELHHPGG